MTGLVTFFQYPFIQFREAERKQLYISPCPQSRRKSYELLYDLKQLSLDPDHPASFGNAIERALLECLHGCGLAHADRRPLCAEQERYVGVFFQFARRLQQLNKFRSRKEPPAAYMAEGSVLSDFRLCLQAIDCRPPEAYKDAAVLKLFRTAADKVILRLIV